MHDREQETMNQPEQERKPHTRTPWSHIADRDLECRHIIALDPDEPGCAMMIGKVIKMADAQLIVDSVNNATRPDHERSASHALMQVKQGKDALIAAERTLTDLGAKIPAFTFTSLDGREVEISLASAQRGYGHHLREIAELKAKVAELETAIGEVKRDCEICDWTCSVCGADPGMLETDLYLTAIRALPLREQGCSDGE